MFKAILNVYANIISFLSCTSHLEEVMNDTSLEYKFRVNKSMRTQCDTQKTFPPSNTLVQKLSCKIMYPAIKKKKEKKITEGLGY